MYICHYCIEYKTELLSDMIKHFKRKTQCKCCTINSYENAFFLSKKKFIFNFDNSNLSKEDYIFIINHYLDEVNIINKDFRKEIYEKTKNIDDLLVNKCDFYCTGCDTSFTRKYNLERHLKTQGACEKIKMKKIALNKNKELCNKIIEKEQKKQEIMNNQINYNNNNYNNCNFLNNNNLSNTHNSTYNVDIKDFVHDKYDLSHIKDEYYLQKDFFLYHNLLKTIMLNKNNHNIFFSNDEAVIYTDNELNKMSSDKAGYMILEKISQSFDEIFYKNTEEAQKYYEFIQKYFRIMKGQYVNDTIYKEYDIDEQRFIYTSNSRLFRSRDKYLAKMISTLGPINNDVREHMCVSLDQINNIPVINPNIENFASTKMRYRDLKNKDGF